MKIEFDDSGLKKFQKKLEKIERDTSGSVSFAKLFNDSLMRKHTSFQSLEEFFGACGIKTDDDFYAYPQDKFDDFVRSNTTFSSWEVMQIAASEEYVAKQFQ